MSPQKKLWERMGRIRKQPLFQMDVQRLTAIFILVGMVWAGYHAVATTFGWRITTQTQDRIADLESARNKVSDQVSNLQTPVAALLVGQANLAGQMEQIQRDMPTREDLRIWLADAAVRRPREDRYKLDGFDAEKEHR